ncbi:MAG: glutamine--fructose-6-phosphate transaminase (isomerizing) [Patescibacteria group bacterium]
MCGIIGYIGNKTALPIALEGLKRLEYRGYDSSGILVLNNKKSEDGGKYNIFKAVGKIKNLETEIADSPVAGTIAIGHTRWATHGKPSINNSHPHSDCKKNIWIAHNGIIENYKTLKKHLEEQGHRFSSETDSEIIAHLIEEFFSHNENLEESVRSALKLIKGTYGLAVVSVKEPDKIIAARSGSPLVLGIGKNENFVASDISAILNYTKKIIYLDDGEMAIISGSDFTIKDLNNEPRKKEIQSIEWTIEESQKKGFPHFMLKEIFEQPESIENSLRGRLIIEDGLAKLGGLENVTEELRNIERIIIVGCGTAAYAGRVGEYMLEEYAGIPVEVEISSEFRYRKPIIDKKTAVLAISQSGETADTLEALREAKRKGALTLGIVNVVGSTIARETIAGVYNHAGPEIGVASTKALTSQLSVLILLTLFLGRQRNMSLVMGKRIVEELKEIPQKIKIILKQAKKIQNIAKKYRKYENFLYLGRKYNYPIALEGALKLKEISYIHAEGYSAGEMKHGPIALIDENFPSLFIAPRDSVYEKIMNGMEEIKARGGKIIAIATKGDKKIARLADDVIYIPKTLEMLTPILSIVPLQLFAYYMGVSKGIDVDKPRNLAKSVTVE